MWLLLLIVLFVVQIVFAVLGFGGLVDWSVWVLISPLLIFVGLLGFLFFCGLVNIVAPTKRSIASDRIGIDSETSAKWIAQQIQQGNITIENVEEEDRAEVEGFLPAKVKKFLPAEVEELLPAALRRKRSTRTWGA